MTDPTIRTLRLRAWLRAQRHTSYEINAMLSRWCRESRRMRRAT